MRSEDNIYPWRSGKDVIFVFLGKTAADSEL